MSKTFVVDFDGTLTEDVWPEWGDWLPGAQDALRELLKHGRVKIFSSRLSPYKYGHDGDEGNRRTRLSVVSDLSKIRRMLNDADLHKVDIHCTEGKPSGDVYIDNLAVRFEGNWAQTLTQVLGGCTLPEMDTTTQAGMDSFTELWRESLKENPKVRVFDSGATRDSDHGKLDFAGFLSPLVVKRYAEYMHAHRVQADGSLRDSGNWKKGIPVGEYLSSLWRHVHDAWLHHEGEGVHAREPLEAALCAVIFNASGWLYELLKNEDKHDETRRRR